MNPRTGAYSSVGSIFADVADDIMQPPERLKISEAAEKYRRLDNPGSYSGMWQNERTPYMVEPMDTLKSRLYSGVAFAGPAQSGKTDALLLNWTLFSAVVDPMDMILYMPTQSAARDFSSRRVGRLLRHSHEVGAKLVKARGSDNKFDKHFTNGMMLTLSWPSVTELAGRPVPRVALTDYDRMPEDVEGDGSPYDLAAKRTTTFGSFAMALAESSPSYPILDPRWIAKTPHEAPPTMGILALYNRGDRRKWYWPCPRCGEFFTAGWKHLVWEPHDNTVQAAATARMECPVCSGTILPHERDEISQFGIWVRDGQRIDSRGRLIGDPPRTEIASFWLNGTAAAFTTWQKLVTTYLDALKEFERTQSDEALKKFFNNDMGDAYLPKAQQLERLPEVLRSRAEPLPQKQVPAGTRFLIATVDVQKNAFVVQVHGVLPGDPFDIVVIDRFTIIKSQRVDEAGDALWVKPGTYLEDWDNITEQVIQASYPLADGSGRRMRVWFTAADSGGKEGVTTNAYTYYRKLKAEGLAGKFMLVKGSARPDAPRAYIDYPDTKRKDRLAGARGDIPLLFLNSNALKDAISNRLDATEPGKGMVRFPDWLPDWWFSEICAERRTEKGWENTPGSRNEAWDLLYYCLGVCISQVIRAEFINWAGDVPAWAKEWDHNAAVFSVEQEEKLAKPAQEGYDFKRFGQLLA